jgi:hypothetical protein
LSYDSLVALALVVLVAGCERPNPLYGIVTGSDGPPGPGAPSDALVTPGDGKGPNGQDSGPTAMTGDAAATAVDAGQSLDLAPGPGSDAAGLATDGAPVVLWKGDVSRNLALYLPLDDGPGKSVLHDASGLGAVAALKSVDAVAGWSTGHFGQALALTGPSWGGYISVTGTPLQQTAAEKFSMTLWIWRTDATSGSLISRRWSGTGGVLFDLALESGSLGIRLDSAAAYNAHVVGNGAVPQGRWVHLAATYDMQVLRLYVDGMEVGAGPFQMALPVDTTAIIIGGLEQSAGTVAARFTGKVDEVTMYSRALAALDVSDLASGARPPLK